jgi:hypothetical protein
MRRKCNKVSWRIPCEKHLRPIQNFIVSLRHCLISSKHQK